MQSALQSMKCVTISKFTLFWTMRFSLCTRSTFHLQRMPVMRSRDIFLYVFCSFLDAHRLIYVINIGVQWKWIFCIYQLLPFFNQLKLAIPLALHLFNGSEHVLEIGLCEWKFWIVRYHFKCRKIYWLSTNLHCNFFINGQIRWAGSVQCCWWIFRLLLVGLCCTIPQLC